MDTNMGESIFVVFYSCLSWFYRWPQSEGMGRVLSSVDGGRANGGWR